MAISVFLEDIIADILRFDYTSCIITLAAVKAC